MAAEGRELGWEDSIKQDAQDYEPIPEGDYNVTIEKFDRSRSKGEGKLPPCNMAVVYFTVHVPEREVTIRENYVLSESVAAFSGSTGVRCDGNARPRGYAKPWRIF